MQSLTSAERRRLRGEAHHLKPVVHVGKDGLTEAVATELDSALESHELVKVRLSGDRDEREAQAQALAESVSAALVATIGGVAILYRRQAEGTSRTV